MALLADAMTCFMMVENLKMVPLLKSGSFLLQGRNVWQLCFHHWAWISMVHQGEWLESCHLQIPNGNMGGNIVKQLVTGL